jgi:carboxyl-terminal processing protease
MRFIKSFKRAVLISVISLIILSSIGFVALRDKEFEILKNLDIYYSLFRELNLFYVDETNPEKLISKSIDGMLVSLDPYTQYIPESKAEEYKFQTTGEYGGIGALIRKADDYVLIAEPYENSPAVRAGLKAGDMLLEIDGKVVKDEQINDISDLLKGSPGTEIELKVKRPTNNKIFLKKITREQIIIPNVPYFGMLTNDIGYIRLSNFTPNASDEVKNALEHLKLHNKVTSLILDIRGNPGGLLIEAVNICGLFVGKGQEIVSTKGKVKQFDNVYYTTSNPIDKKIPIIVLVNRSSASASEIVAGSLQDLDRAVILGQRTFGKGLVQTTRRLSYNAQLKVTTAKYYIPSGRCIQALDYAHRNEDGSVGYIPDSLITEFKTKNGRKVFNGGGIQPDVKVEPEIISNISYSLYSKNLLFDYATEYASRHDSIQSPRKYSITDEEYESFIKFLKDKPFDYETETEAKLNELINSAKKEKYYSISENEFNALKSKLSHNREKDLQMFKEEIKDLLTEEIVSRYYYQKGRIEYSLLSDNQVVKAIEFLNDSLQYNKVLNTK